MKHSSLIICVGALLVVAPLVFGAYQVHEVATTMQEFAATNYMGSVNFGSKSYRAWEIVACVVGVLLVFSGVLIEAIARRSARQSRSEPVVARS